jgi:putative NADPH-quinone reductase
VRTLLVLCHPEPGSFNHAIAERARDVMAAAGHAVSLHDLYAERFDPVLAASELRRGYSLDPPVQAHGNELEAAAALLLVHPEWWGGPPALLKGWVERVFSPGLAYEYEGADFTARRRRGLLAGKRALVFATTDAAGSPALERFWRESVFGFCGLERSAVHVMGRLRESSAAERGAWLDFVEHTVRAELAAG